MRILVDGMGWNGFCGFQQKIVKKGRTDTEQTHQQVNALENEGLSIQNMYFCGSTRNREVEKCCEKTTKLLNP